MKELINEITKNFDFEKVHRAMQALDWHWARSNGVPTLVELVLCAQELLCGVLEMDVDMSIGTGGFRATKLGSKDEEKGLILEFVLTSTTFYAKWLKEGE